MRAFILGNSGELLDHDLSLLKGEHVFASNCFPLRMPEIITHYVCLDIVMGLLPEVRSLVPKDCKKYYSRLVWNAIHEEDNVNVFDCFPDEMMGFNFSETKVYTANTVTYVMIQIAVALGYKEIYLLGVDFGLPANGIMHIPEQKIMMDLLKSKNLRNISRDKRIDVSTHEEFKGNYIKSFLYAQNALDLAGIKTYNLSRGGNLKCFPRAELVEVLNKEIKNVG